MSVLKDCDTDLLVIIAVLIGMDLAKGLDPEEQNIFAQLLSLVAGVLATIAVVELVHKTKAEKDKSDIEKMLGQKPEDEQFEEATVHVPETVVRQFDGQEGLEGRVRALERKLAELSALKSGQEH